MINLVLLFFILWLIVNMYEPKIHKFFGTNNNKTNFKPNQDNEIDSEITGEDEDGNIVVELKQDKKNEFPLSKLIMAIIILGLIFTLIPFAFQLLFLILRLIFSFLPLIILGIIFHKQIFDFFKNNWK